MKGHLTVFKALFALALFVPVLVSAQAANPAPASQQSLLTELQSLQQEVSSLESTLEALIASVSLSATSSTTTIPSAISSGIPQQPALPLLAPPAFASPTSLPSANLSGDDLISALLQSIMPSVSTSSFAAPPVPSANVSNTPSAQAVSSAHGIAVQLDPSCVAGLWGNGAQCGGLYFCTSAGGFWSTQACLSSNGE